MLIALSSYDFAGVSIDEHAGATDNSLVGTHFFVGTGASTVFGAISVFEMLGADVSSILLLQRLNVPIDLRQLFGLY